MVNRFRSFIFIIILIQSFSASAEIPETVYIDFKGSFIELDLESPEPKVVKVSAQDIVLSESDNGWVVKRVDTDTYHVKHGEWDDGFWEIDAKENSRYSVGKGEFGVKGNRGGFSGRLKKVDSHVLFGSPFGRLELDTVKTTMRFYWGNISILGETNFEVKKFNKNIYYFRAKGIEGFYYKVDVNSKEVHIVSNSDFAIKGGNEEYLPLHVGYSKLMNIDDLNRVTDQLLRAVSLKKEQEVFSKNCALFRGSEPFKKNAKGDNSGEKNINGQGGNKVYLNFKTSQLLFDVKPEEDKIKAIRDNMPQWQKNQILQPSNFSLLFEQRELASNFNLVSQKGLILKEVKPNIFHIKFKDWQDFFWKVDTDLNKVFVVRGGSFGLGECVEYENTEIRIEQIKYKGLKDQRFVLKSSNSYAQFDKANKELKIYWGKTLILNSNNFEVRQVDKDIYKIKTAGTQDKGYKLDLNMNKLYVINHEDKEFLTHTEVTYASKNEMEKFAGTDLWEDFGYWKVKPERPLSPWIEAQKRLYNNLLQNETYDVLVIPFQVQGHAIDRIGRSLMTRYLVEKIESNSSLKVADPSLVAKALGERNRRFSLEEIHQLANDLKVKTLIIGHVGHDLDMNMRLTLKVKEKKESEYFDYSSKALTFDWRNKPFSDEQIPSDVFNNILDDVTSKLPIKLGEVSKAKKYKRLKTLPVPETLMGMFNLDKKSPLKDIYYLQFLGMLYPEDTPGKEFLFERSLVALAKVSKKSPDYALLRARALFYLSRRPAAIAALGKPKTSAERAFFALLNGNLPELKKWTEKIKSPLHQIISKIELNDLIYSYTRQQLSEEQIELLTKDMPDWALLISRRLMKTNSWFRQNNFFIKAEMDKVFPAPGYTAEVIAKSKMAAGRNPFGDGDLDLSAYKHYEKILNEHSESYFCNKYSLRPHASDYLNLLYEISESNLLQNIRITVENQALPKAGIELLDRYEAIYVGHPEMAYLRAEALRKMSDKESGLSRKNLLRSSKKYAYNAYYWLQGQTITSKESYILFGLDGGRGGYLSDFPSRPDWLLIPYSTPGLKDRKVIKKGFLYGKNKELYHSHAKLNESEIALRYSHKQFHALKAVVENFNLLNLKKEADKVLVENKHRFVGHYERTVYFAELELSKNNVDKAIKLYEKAISANPGIWNNYLKLGELFIAEGRHSESRELFLSFPPFNDSEATNRVQLSNNAASAGANLLRVGAVEEAIPLLQLSASYRTGSNLNIASRAYLALLDNNLHEAAAYHLQRFNRYENEYALKDYLSLLFLLGYSDKAWAIFNNAEIGKFTPEIWRSVFVGLRKDGMSNDEIAKWFNKNHKMKDRINKGYYPYSLLLMTCFIDRAANPESINKIFSKRDLFSEELKLFLKAMKHFEDKDYTRSFETLEKNDFFKNKWALTNFALPYVALIAAKSGNMEVVYDLYERASEYKVKISDIKLAKAYAEGIKQNHKKAIRLLKSARNNIGLMKNRLIFPWYQLVKAAEWLYEDSGEEEYIELALEWAKIHQRRSPSYAWAYAVEAKHTKSKQDRTRALGITLYLDKHSARVSHFSEKEKKEAIEWMEKNNPFLVKHEEEQVIKTEI